MIDHQKLRESIRSFLAGTDQTNSPEMAETAVSFAAACAETNDRLRRCVDYLRRGHRSEAIHLSEIHPNLLDVCGSLDIPELAEWESLCAGYGWPRPVRILVDAAQELNESYATEQQLEPILVKHRRMALEEAPLAERLSILRELARCDPENVGWNSDIGAYEQVRVRELKSEALTAIKQRDIVAVDRLLAEVTNQEWRIAMSMDVVSGLTNASNAFHREIALRDLRAMLPRLHAAYAAMSYTDCKQVVAEWCSIVTTYQVTVPDDLREAIRPVNDWLSDQQELRERQRNVQRACDALRHAMDADAPLIELQHLYRKAKGFDLELPGEVDREYQNKLAVYQRGERVRRQTLLFMLVLFTGALVAIVWILFYVLRPHA